jgi:hypothetical protein
VLLSPLDAQTWHHFSIRFYRIGACGSNQMQRWQLGDLLAETIRVPRPLRQLLRDSYWVTRIDAMEAVDAIGDYRVLPLLTPLLYDPTQSSVPTVHPFWARLNGNTSLRASAKHCPASDPNAPK